LLQVGLMYDDFAFDMAYGDGDVSNLEADTEIVFEELNSYACSPSQVAAVLPVEKQPCCQTRVITVTFAPCWHTTHHEVTPYAEVYGTHPSNFDFDKRVEPPSWCFVGDADSDSDADDHEENETRETYSTSSCRQVTIANAGDLLSTCPWELRKADHRRNHDAEQDASDDDQDTQSPDSSEVNSDGSADSNMGDEDDSDIVYKMGQPIWCPCCRELLQSSQLGSGAGFAAGCLSCDIQVSVKHRNGNA